MSNIQYTICLMTLSITHHLHQMLGRSENNEMEVMWKASVVVYPGICLAGLRKANQNFRQVSQCPGQNVNSRPTKYKFGVLTTLSKWITMILDIFQRDL